jgi:hypothetical protein
MNDNSKQSLEKVIGQEVISATTSEAEELDVVTLELVNGTLVDIVGNEIEIWEY